MNPNAAAFVPIPEKVKAVIRRVLNPSSDKFVPSALVWKITTERLVLYRGQCDRSTKAISRVGNNPLEISSQYGKPISTSTSLTSKIQAFACKPPDGRMFEIHVEPGVPVARLQDSINRYNVEKATFQFLKDELPDRSAYKNMSLEQILGVFFKILKTENEVLLDLSKGVFRKKSREPEDWMSPEMEGKYITGFFPIKGGRRRTLRSRRKKRTYRLRV